jgi:hypothetical protein
MWILDEWHEIASPSDSIAPDALGGSEKEGSVDPTAMTCALPIVPRLEPGIAHGPPETDGMLGGMQPNPCNPRSPAPID